MYRDQGEHTGCNLVHVVQVVRKVVFADDNGTSHRGLKVKKSKIFEL